MIAGALWILSGSLGKLTQADLRTALVQIAPGKLRLAGLLTCLSFAALGLQDVIAARAVAPGKVALWKGFLAGSAANAIAGTLGFHAVTASLVRYRIYRSEDLGLIEVAGIVAASSAAILLSFPTTLSLALLLGRQGQTAAGRSDPLAIAACTAFLCLLAALLAWLGRKPRRLAVGRFRVSLPSAPVAACQIALGAGEMIAAIGGLYHLLPDGLAPPFALFALIYIGAAVGGLVSHVPGGLGVFEAAMLAMLGSGREAALLGALLAYRLIYNLAPFLIAAGALLLFELVQRNARLSSTADKAR